MPKSKGTVLHAAKSVARLPWRLSPAVRLWTLALVIVVCSAAASYFHYRLPDPLPASETRDFSEERARKHIRVLSEEIGVREVGTAAEDATIEYIVGQLAAVRDSGARTQPLELRVEHADGQHLFEIIGVPIIKTYLNVTNIAVRLPCTQCVSDKALLVNTHFDSTLNANGAADAATPVAVMIETIRILATDPRPLRNSIVFLFNGAEETLQDASHGFITQSPWFKDVISVLNLEACGVSGKTVMFQSKSKWMLDAYAHVSYPHGTAMANDLFRTGLVISDTDYKQFIDHAGAQIRGGLDWAIYQHSYLYHTRGDVESNLPPGTIQHMGTNALDLLRHVAYAANLDDLARETPETMTYWDVLGLGFFMTSIATARTLALELALVALVYLYITAPPRALGRALWVYFRSLMVALAVPAVVAATAMSANMQLRWFSRESFPVLCYGPLVVFGFLQGAHLGPVSRSLAVVNETLARKAVLLFHTIILVVMALSGLSSLFLPGVHVASSMVGTLVPPLYYHFAMVAPLLLLQPMLTGILNLFVPLAGRMGMEAPAEVVVAVLVWLCAVVLLTPLSPLVHRLSARRHALLSQLTLVFTLASWLFVLASPQYTKLTPKRLALLHSYHADTGASHFHLLKLDSAPYPSELVESISQVVGGVPVPDMHPEERFHALQSLYPVNMLTHALSWDTTHMAAKFWVNDDAALTPAARYADVYAPRTDRIVATTDRAAGTRTVTIPCAANAHNMFTVYSFAGNVTWASAPVKLGKYDRYYIRQSSGGGGRVDWEEVEGEEKRSEAARKCDFSFTVQGTGPIVLDVAANSKFLGRRNYLIRRITPLLPEWTDAFMVDAIHKRVVL